LGDITSLALLSWISTVLYDVIGKFTMSGGKVIAWSSSSHRLLNDYLSFRVDHCF
jgi:hypothetical protein